VIDRFHYLKVGLGLVLIFIGVKMGVDFTLYKVETKVSLGVIAAILGVSIVTSIVRPLPRSMEHASSDAPATDSTAAQEPTESDAPH